jgi:signal transduction histidine kinase
MNKSPSLERIEAQALRRQQIAFCILKAILIAALLLLHTHFSYLLGRPSKGVVLILALVFFAKVIEGIWLWEQRNGISERAARLGTAISMPAIFLLAAICAILTDRDEVPYFVLLSVPILQCAYRFGLIPTMVTIMAAIGMIFGWTQHFYAAHPPARPTEFLEAGMISVVFCVMGLVVWYLVSQLQIKQTKLYSNMMELEVARERLVEGERLAAVGRLASGVAHEIRNPVAMISSSLATAAYPALQELEREEMFAIAVRESRRLELLTNDFLTYARPSRPQRISFPIQDILQHVVRMTRMRAAGRGIDVDCESCAELIADIDGSQIESALVNLGLNAVDATPDRGRIIFRVRVDDSRISIDVENSGLAIPEADLLEVFEPFFTTKPAGTGLGLAIARTVARSHGGDLWVSQNLNGTVVFTFTITIQAEQDEKQEVAYGQSAGR